MTRTSAELAKRCALLSTLIAAFALTNGCSTFISDPDLLDPNTESITLHCYTRFYFVWMTSCSVSAIDGHRTNAADFANFSAKVKPGRRWVEFTANTNFGGAGGMSEVCAFALDFEAKHEYHLKAHSLRLDPVPSNNTNVAPLQTGEIAVQVNSSAGTLRDITIPVICSHGGGSLCRSSQDCISSRHEKCIPQPPHAIGRCEPVSPRAD